MLLQELMHFVVVVKLRTALLKMLDPAVTRILKLWWETALDSTTLNVGCKYTRSIQATDVLL